MKIKVTVILPLLVIIFILLAVFSSCKPYQYMSSNQYVPLNKEKNELKANVGLSSGPFFHSGNYHEKRLAHIYEIINSLQLGYTITNHISVFSTGFYRDKWSQSSIFTSENDNTIWGNSGLKELNFGCSYYKFYNNHTFEILSGVGFGKLFYDYSDNYVEFTEVFFMKANKLNYYIQPDFSLMLNENVEIGLFSKFLYCRYYNISYTTENIEYVKMSEHKYFMGRESANLYFIEPGLVIRRGSKLFKIQFSASKTINLNINKITYQPLSVKLSLFLNFNLSTKKN